ncbi:tetratricopeptide repeat protein [Psychrobacillus lasiicapitis]|uniref:Tetratricopeptide repeat protein n=1 Tax=Psychrobacillus lasiicapitis TaxID=1636719 RepID=A0A544TH19_9BACI|nr:tetratricopeptide repeat protein [Psychrobacillus lasiicapitis]TQR16752.1 tetratricopeptide repeat protein [Psychrobacillus lasiicapitis]GGA27499.1 hypothetical protein GCM10011384_16060 [Psychrobacillus lasiicapitis]
MTDGLAHAIDLRNEGNFQESNALLLRMVEKWPNDAVINYQCAWSFDVLGKENEAITYYENAIALGLPESDLQEALLGLGSTYRALGEYEKSRDVLLKGINLFPTNHSIQVFYAMTLYNLNEHHHAMELLLKCLLDTTSDKDILNYQKAIRFYSDKLNNVWE